VSEALSSALQLLISLDQELYRIIWLSLLVSGSAVVLAALCGIPLGTLLGLKPLPAVRAITVAVYTLMGLPPVVAGLLVYLLLSRRGLLGPLNLLFTVEAMIIVQTLLAIPIIAGLTAIAVRSKGREIRETALVLGAGRLLLLRTLIHEARYGILGAVIAGFGRLVAEVGAVMMVGGNIEGHTRVLTTAIVLETRKGNFALAMALGIILLLLALLINSALYRLQAGGTGGA
jgi:tungstate transport system permease protein